MTLKVLQGALCGMSPRPVSLALQGRETLLIRWSDGLEVRYPAALSRRQCPCAHCLQRRHAPENPLQVLQVHELGPVHITQVTPVGNYAYNICFSDQHTTGIFTLEQLRSLGEQIAAREGGSPGPNPQPGP